ncbi:MAG TPA: hypothetical protein EYG53_08350 [Gammaproteobacteria bacterium]|nr:hypothetical protein [Gammaproteobacteria bacterium]HIM05208.1 hypothetical protein [Gammaproteobacteria bacterium]
MNTPAQRFKGWSASDLAATDCWIFKASAELAHASGSALQSWCQPVIDELRHGMGVAFIRGLGCLDESALRRLYLSIGSCIGNVEDTYGTLYDVTDSGESHLEKAIPVSQTKAGTSIHTDSSRLETHPRWVGLVCIRQAPVGGGSRLTSAVAVHDHLNKIHPELLSRLKRSFHRDVVTPGVIDREAAIEKNVFPIFIEADDGPTLRYMRYWIEKGHERLGKPLQPIDTEAFDALDETLNNPKFRHDFAMMPGDILFIDNHKVGHDREAYEDDPTAPRLMARLWLNAH